MTAADVANRQAECRSIKDYLPQSVIDRGERSFRYSENQAVKIDQLIEGRKVEVVEYLLSQGKISEDEVLKGLTNIPPLEITSFLASLDDASLQQYLFREIYRLNPEKGKSIILGLKNANITKAELTGPFESNYFIAARLISSLPTAKQKNLLADIRVIDQRVAALIEEQRGKQEEYERTCFQHQENISLNPRKPDQNMVIVGQGTYKIANQGLLATGLGPCIALTLYDSKTKTTILMHFDPSQGVDGVFDELKAQLSANGVNLKDMQAGIIGGWQNFSENSYFNIVFRLKQEGLSVSNYNYLNPYGKSTYFLIDTANGKISGLEKDVFMEALWGKSAKK